jgi:hypothetical protein
MPLANLFIGETPTEVGSTVTYHQVVKVPATTIAHNSSQLVQAKQTPGEGQGWQAGWLG